MDRPAVWAKPLEPSLYDILFATTLTGVFASDLSYAIAAGP
ncbi:hypothetical protein NYE70_11530 [Paenibacillus sp. FSL R5-0407]